jgi:hypothetical protein
MISIKIDQEKKTPYNSLSSVFSKAFSMFVHKLDSIPSSCVQVNGEHGIILEEEFATRRGDSVSFALCCCCCSCFYINPKNSGGSWLFEGWLITSIVHYSL